MFQISILSSHDALNQRGWNSKVTRWFCDVAIGCGAIQFHRLRYACFDDCVCIEEASHSCALPTKSKCRRATCPKIRPILMREATLHTWSMTIFEPLELMEPCKVYQINSIDAYRMMTFKISIQGGTKLFKKWYLRVYTSQKLLESVQLQVVLTLQNIFETTNSSAEGECFEWKAIGHCSKGDSCSFRNNLASGNICAERQEGHSPSLALKAKHILTKRYSPKVQTATQ